MFFGDRGKLEGVDEKIRICIVPENAFLVKTGDPDDGDNAKGYTAWRNCIGHYDIEVPKGV